MNSETLKKIQTTIRKIAPNYTFGYYDVEDIEQECFLMVMEVLPKFDPSLSSLETFITTHLKNKLRTFIRDKYLRLDFKCKICNNKNPKCEYCERRRRKFLNKKHLMEPVDIDGVSTNEPNLYVNTDLLLNLEIEETLNLIDNQLELIYRNDYLKMRAGTYVPKVKREIIENRIKEILNGK